MGKKKNNPGIYAEITALKSDVAVLKSDVGWLKEQLRKVDNRLWGILAGVIVSILLGLLKFVH